MNKAMIESYARNLLGQVIAAVTIVSAASNISNPANFGSHEWLLVANALWASLVPVALRYFNKKDPAFGKVAAVGLAELANMLNKATIAKPAKKAAAKKAAPKKK
jgi:hypothetical protein